MISKEAEKILFEIIANESDGKHWSKRFENVDHRKDTILRCCFKELIALLFAKQLIKRLKAN